MFVKQALKSWRNTGAVAPSSRFLVQKMIKDVDFANSSLIVEFGAGNGQVTERLWESIGGHGRLVSFEINETFLEATKARLPKHERLQIIRHSALQFDEVVAQYGKVDYFFSSLPLTLFPKREVKAFLAKVVDSLNPGGKFIQYQYSMHQYFMMKKFFKSVELRFTLLNLPPAVVYSCS
ncbi:MAG: methyltransferase domain-containing protein [Lewinellaceae bacterium]|nr:methyltransferase domain-containing protein [Lewinellaceae bacterium]